MSAGDFSHLSVMPQEVLHWIAPRSGGWYLDGTLGGAGHARLILESAPGCKLIGLDRDPAALAAAREVLDPYAGRISLHHATFDQAPEVVARLDLPGLDGMLLDLGVSSHQLDTPERGFSFRFDAPLDMRMNPTAGETAADILNDWDEAALVKIFFEYGEERFSRRIVRAILARRQDTRLERTGELAELVRDTVPGGRRPSRIHPATRVFQALRIAVNDELGQVERGLKAGIDLLKPGGRLVVISFHSLEDRIVKRMFRDKAKGCVCPPRMPICQCNKTPEVKVLTRKGVKATAAEIEHNVRSRSAILRAVERC